ncbi:MAG: nucleotidyl transferase AbiEii/AbiGii toxin family protein [Cupriavidus necator]
MNENYRQVIAAADADRRDLFLSAAARMGTTARNVEKDFWACWTLDVLFNGLPADAPRLLFKGGTSLSKAFGLIHRFSEDIDIAVFRDDLGHATGVADLDALSGKKRRARLEAIRTACRTYIIGRLADHFGRLATALLPPRSFRVEPDPDDQDGQSLLFWYPGITAAPGDYIRSAIKIEAGARSALDPHITVTVTPFISADLAGLDLTVANVTAVKPERTFWDKIIILHGLRQWHERRGVLRYGGQRISRHYYDLHQLVRVAEDRQWMNQKALAIDCAQHARLFFGSPDLGLETARFGSFALMPNAAMRASIARDYEAMAGMVFGEIPVLDSVLDSIQQIEHTVNGGLTMQ